MNMPHGEEWLYVSSLLTVMCIIPFLLWYKFIDTGIYKNSSLLRIIPINNEENIFIKVHEKKDIVYSLFKEVAEELNISLKYIKSQYYDDSIWLVCSTTQQTEYGTKDSSVVINFILCPYHIYDVRIDIEILTSRHTEEFKKIINLSKEDIIKIVEIISSEDGVIKYKPTTYTNFSFIFWKNKNKLKLKYRKSFDTLALFSLGMISYQSFLGRKHWYKITTGKPSFEPRQLIKLDSWQTTIIDIGKEKENILDELTSKLLTLDIDMENGFKVTKEKIWYWGVDGKEEREQLVCIFNRGYVFVHIHTYGKDLYIGWDAHLNYGAWEEYKVANGYSRGKVKDMELYSIRPTWRQVNEYDLDDANFLLETIHSNIVQISKRIIKEQKIDQEIDFSIVRESRADALKAEKPKEDKNKNRFKRLS